MVKEYFKGCDYSYALGLSLTFELIKKHPKDIKIVYISNKIQKNEVLIKLLRELENKNIDYEYNDEIFNKLSLKENCYVIGVFNKYSMKLDNHQNHLVIETDDIEDIGTMIRSAVAYNYFNIAIISKDLDIFQPNIIRVSVGSIFHANVEVFDSIDTYKQAYSRNYLHFSKNGNKNLKDIKPLKPYSLIYKSDTKDAYMLDKINQCDDVLYLAVGLYELNAIKKEN